MSSIEIKLDFGDIITIATVIGTVLFAFWRLNAKVNQLHSAMFDEHGQFLFITKSSSRHGLQEQDRKIGQNSKAIQAQEQEIHEIKVNLAYIKQKLDNAFPG